VGKIDVLERSRKHTSLTEASKRGILSGKEHSLLGPSVVVSCPRSPAEKGLSRYMGCIERAGGYPRPMLAGEGTATQLLETTWGLLLPGGIDVHSSRYGQEPEEGAGPFDLERDALEFALVEAALAADRPILAICRGMQVLNVALGGSLIQHIPGHMGSGGMSAFHEVRVSSEGRLATILGSAGTMRVNSRHHQGVAQKAPALIASVYAPSDGLIEGLESHQHRWVIGIQCHPERADEVPDFFQNLFKELVEAVRRSG
jgi:gamma-glutamyl-gamma-aminobutyrate hydrolase PuuD